MCAKTTTRKNLAEDHETHLHSVQFYTDDKFLVDCLARFVGSALGAGDASVVIATEEHRAALSEKLAARGLDVTRAVEQGRYVSLDASETLDRFMVNGWPDETKFADVVAGVIARARNAAQREQGRTALFGEMVALLWERGNIEAALRLERLWNQIAQSHSFSLLCAYPLRDFYREEHAEAFQQVCGEHTAVIPNESYALAPNNDARQRLVAQWQQKAVVLEHEIVRNHEAQVAANRLAAIVRSSEDAIASKDLNGIITSWNAAAERMFGYKAEEIIGKPVLMIIPPELHADEDMILGKIRKGHPLEHFETVRVHKDGRRIPVSLTVSPVRDERGTVVGAAKIVRDITERKRAEESLRRAEKLAATGRMAASIAHEINNPLEAVTNLLYLLRGYVEGDAGKAHLAMAESELNRVAQITRQTLAFYRDTVAAEPVELGEILDGVTDIFSRKAARKHIVITRSYKPCRVHGMKGELRQLFSNLVDNAIDAAPSNGEVRISIECDDTTATVLVSDNGSGVRPEDVPRLFDPFFTTKQFGTGLGLWVAQEIAGKHGGKIAVDPTPAGSGATFRVTLRALAQQQQPDVASAA